MHEYRIQPPPALASHYQHPALTGVWRPACSNDVHAYVLQGIDIAVQAGSILRNGVALLRLLPVLQACHVPNAGLAAPFPRNGSGERARGAVVHGQPVPSLDFCSVLRGVRALLFGEVYYLSVRFGIICELLLLVCGIGYRVCEFFFVICDTVWVSFFLFFCRSLHPPPATAAASVPEGESNMVNLYRHWTFALFYVVSELFSLVGVLVFPVKFALFL